MIYFNENEPFAADWIGNLWPDATVDRRSIADVDTGDTLGYGRCHFFGGVGGWEYALRLAGWPDDEEVWTGSCPCQPFSVAGKRGGTGDSRHLWPEFCRLIAERRPSVVFGEQVASRDGREWLAGVRADLEDLGYAVGGADLCAAGVGAPHIRQRLFWVAHSDRQRRGGLDPLLQRTPTGGWDEANRAEAAGRGAIGGLADAGRERINGLQPERQSECGEEVLAGGDAAFHWPHGRMGHADHAGSQGRGVLPERGDEWTPWASGVGIDCLDGKTRRVEPGVHPLVDGFPGRAPRLRAYGNAIVPQVAATFVKAFMETIS